MRDHDYSTGTQVGWICWPAILACALLVGCGQHLTRWQHDTYTVRSGDTLYAIAWHFGVDQRDLARWNGLGSGAVIYPGQQLRLYGSPSATPRQASREGRSSVARPPVRPSPSATSSGQAGRSQQPAPKWQWPTAGAVIANFGNPRSVGKGIDIAGSEGAPVLAAADGRVVYAGSGLLGYGKLIIIKHNETYLSAYGHNATLLAGQGDSVASGQRIAEMGLGPRRVAMLHFEIRVNGDAVDPLRFLPKR